ncbi:MAG: hypothetical protein RLY16_1202, partial [Bacteroidota bacterium]
MNCSWGHEPRRWVNPPSYHIPQLFPKDVGDQLQMLGEWDVFD